jgi:hypothetical protein
MTSNWLRIGAAALFFSLTASAACAQQQVQQPPGAAAQSPANAGANQTFRAKQVLGSKVTIQGNAAVGTVEDLVFDDAGNLEYAIVDREGKLVTLPWAAVRFNVDQRLATVNITADKYNSIPTYTTTTYPEFYTPTYRTQVYGYFGLTPGQLRRAERRGVIP